MSSDKINESLIDSIVGRIKQEYSLKGDNQVADLIGISAQNFSLKKRRGTVINDILLWAVYNNKDLNLLFKGKASREASVRRRDNIYLDKAFEWANETLTKDVRNQNWFEVQFEKAFPEFLTWKEGKEGTAEKNKIAQFSKIA